MAGGGASERERRPCNARRRHRQWAAGGQLESLKSFELRSSRGKRKPIITDGHGTPCCDSLEALPPTLVWLASRTDGRFFSFFLFRCVPLAFSSDSPSPFPKGRKRCGRPGHVGVSWPASVKLLNMSSVLKRRAPTPSWSTPPLPTSHLLIGLPSFVLLHQQATNLANWDKKPTTSALGLPPSVLARPKHLPPSPYQVSMFFATLSTTTDVRFCFISFQPNTQYLGELWMTESHSYLIVRISSSSFLFSRLPELFLGANTIHVRFTRPFRTEKISRWKIMLPGHFYYHETSICEPQWPASINDNVKRKILLMAPSNFWWCNQPIRHVTRFFSVLDHFVWNKRSSFTISWVTIDGWNVTHLTAEWSAIDGNLR